MLPELNLSPIPFRVHYRPYWGLMNSTCYEGHHFYLEDALLAMKQRNLPVREVFKAEHSDRNGGWVEYRPDVLQGLISEMLP